MANKGKGGSEILLGTELDDRLIGGGKDDTLTGGKGDDFLNGGGGSDKYVFNFTVSSSSSVTYTYPDGPTYDDLTPTSVPTGTTYGAGTIYNNFGALNSAWANYSDDVNAWYDANNGGTIDTNQTDTTVNLTNPGGNTVSHTYDNTIATAGAIEITDSDGNDTIAQFHNAGPNVDTVELHGLEGLTADQLDTLFDLSISDVDSDGNLDTVLSWDGGAITFLGTSQWGTDVDQFFTSAQVVIV